MGQSAITGLRQILLFVDNDGWTKIIKVEWMVKNREQENMRTA